MRRTVFIIVGLATIAAGSALVASVVNAAPLPIVQTYLPADSPTTPAHTYPVPGSKVNPCRIGCVPIGQPAASPTGWVVVRPTR